MKQLTLLLAFVTITLLSFGQAKKPHTGTQTGLAPISITTTPKDIDVSPVLTFKRVDTIPGAVLVITRSISGPNIKSFQAFEIDSIFNVSQPTLDKEKNRVTYENIDGKKVKGIMAVTEGGSVFVDLYKWYQFIPANQIQ